MGWLGNILKGAGKVVGKVAKTAAPFAGLIPGVGIPLGAALGAGGNLLGSALAGDKLSVGGALGSAAAGAGGAALGGVKGLGGNLGKLGQLSGVMGPDGKIDPLKLAGIVASGVGAVDAHNSAKKSNQLYDQSAGLALADYQSRLPIVQKAQELLMSRMGGLSEPWQPQESFAGRALRERLGGPTPTSAPPPMGPPGTMPPQPPAMPPGPGGMPFGPGGGGMPMQPGMPPGAGPGGPQIAFDPTGSGGPSDWQEKLRQLMARRPQFGPSSTMMPPQGVRSFA